MTKLVLSAQEIFKASLPLFLFLFFVCSFLTEVWLIYNVVLVLSVQKSNSALHI